MACLGIPIKLLHETQGHVVTLELNNGSTYRGKLFEAEDNMNVQLRDITATARDGRVSHLDQVYIRGSYVRFFIVPDMLKNAPMFKSKVVASREQEDEVEDEIYGRFEEPDFNCDCKIYLCFGPAFYMPALQRILVVGRKHSGKLRLLQHLTGSIPIVPRDAGCHAGLTHLHTIKNRYYEAEIIIWVDEFENPEEWVNPFLNDEAEEVRKVLGAVILTFDLEQDRTKVLEDLKSVEKLMAACGDDWDGICLAVGCTTGTRTSEGEYWDMTCMDCGFEYVDLGHEESDLHGAKTGVDRIREALEVFHWTAEYVDADPDSQLEEDYDITAEASTEGQAFINLHQSLLDSEDGGSNEDVENLQEWLDKLRALKGTHSTILGLLTGYADQMHDMSFAERKKRVREMMASPARAKSNR
ncbi:Small nuclear ribonucleoprotein Sm D3 [Neolecta irregularis DAH-3]|uniref:Small nuclear ribonucleoprotein Sm D3 n=1 Tax=Neolecta irregularis (strain DAH-3) TaxID=1198029 RepID=A0A1U7LVH1_NEOID|nr:Small nuclear ribonucleoprotein Sm D3 [Neolecta irregularis DAH-3]|eukprot:OLL26675.1 Small nuclear ribonucleoprotein Sm D3 [Neolecta irregularis DAH-3]